MSFISVQAIYYHKIGRRRAEELQWSEMRERDGRNVISKNDCHEAGNEIRRDVEVLL